MNANPRLHARTALVISHRWESRAAPDLSGERLRAVQEYLRRHSDVKLIWYDYWCLPQGNDKTLAEEYLFTKTLPHINLLYLGMSVLVLLDSSFFGRFWTCFEAFLSMQEASANGLRAATAPRVTVKTVLGANAALKQGLIDKWSACTVEQAYMLLEKDDIEVTKLVSCAGEHAHAPRMACRRSQHHIACQSRTQSGLPTPSPWCGEYRNTKGSGTYSW